MLTINLYWLHNVLGLLLVFLGLNNLKVFLIYLSKLY
jgi:hypothetical protein